MKPRTPDTEPLFLRGNADCRILRDGPALCIRFRDRADRRVPLRRVACVNSLGPVQWDTQALIACAEAGITISFASAEGRLLGRWLPPQTTPVSALGCLLNQSMAQVQRQQELQAWLAARQRIAMNRLGQNTATSPLGAGQRLDWARKQLPRVASRPLSRTWRRLEAFSRCDLQQQLLLDGVETDALDARIATIDLLAELHRLLCLHSLPRWRDGIARLKPPRAGKLKPGFPAAVAVYRQTRPALLDDIRQQLHDLHRHLLETAP